MQGLAGQMWRIQTSDGTVTTLSSNMPDIMPVDYEFIAPHNINDFTGLRVLNINSTWNGTTFQYIAFDPSNEERQNSSAAAVTLEVGGECRKMLDVHEKVYQASSCPLPSNL